MFCKLLKIGVLSAAFGAISGCATPTVQTNVSVSSKLSMTPDLNPGLHAMPDWGDTVAIVPSSSAKKNDATYRAIAGSLQNLLTAAHMQVVNRGLDPVGQNVVDGLAAGFISHQRVKDRGLTFALHFDQL